MTIRKSYLYAVIAGLMVVGVLSIFSFYYLSTNRSVSCKKFQEQYPFMTSCGLLTSDITSTSHQLIVEVESAVSKGDRHYLKLKTKDAKGGIVTETFTLPPNSLKTNVTTLLPEGSRDFQNGRIFPNVENVLLEGRKIIQRIKKDDELLITVITPSSKEIEEIINKVGKSYYTECLPYHQKFITYLKNPTASNFFQMKRDSLFKSCNVTLLQLTQHER